MFTLIRCLMRGAAVWERGGEGRMDGGRGGGREGERKREHVCIRQSGQNKVDKRERERKFSLLCAGCKTPSTAIFFSFYLSVFYFLYDHRARVYRSHHQGEEVSGRLFSPVTLP